MRSGLFSVMARVCMLLGVAGCGGGSGGSDSDAGTAQACVTSADCGEGQVCAAALCRPRVPGDCAADSDCEGNQTCDLVTAQCVEPARCGRDEDCLGDRYCGAGLACVAPCAADADCPSGACAEGRCAGDSPSGCTNDDQCPAGQLCASGACVERPACDDATPCTGALICDTGACREVDGCLDDTGCFNDLRRVCVDGACADGCDPAAPDACRGYLRCAPDFRCSELTCMQAADCGADWTCKVGLCVPLAARACSEIGRAHV